MLLSWDPNLEDHIPNTIPAETGMTSAQFVSYVIFSVVILPFLWIRPHRIQKWFHISSIITMVFFVILLIWSLATMGPEGFGSTIKSGTGLPQTQGPYSVAWLMIWGAMTTIGSIAAGILNTWTCTSNTSALKARCFTKSRAPGRGYRYITASCSLM